MISFQVSLSALIHTFSGNQLLRCSICFKKNQRSESESSSNDRNRIFLNMMVDRESMSNHKTACETIVRIGYRTIIPLISFCVIIFIGINLLSDPLRDIHNDQHHVSTNRQSKRQLREFRSNRVIPPPKIYEVYRPKYRFYGAKRVVSRRAEFDEFVPSTTYGESALKFHEAIRKQVKHENKIDQPQGIQEIVKSFAFGNNRSILNRERAAVLKKGDAYERIHNPFLVYSARGAVDVIAVIAKLEDYDNLLANWHAILKSFHAIILLDEVTIEATTLSLHKICANMLMCFCSTYLSQALKITRNKFPIGWITNCSRGKTFEIPSAVTISGY